MTTTIRRPRVGSLFSGVGGFDLGLERAGFETTFLCENDAWKRSVLERHWPHVPIHHDVCEFEPNDHERHLDLLVGGFPCQDLSTAGARAGLAGARSGLAFEFLRIANTIRPRWIILENVPGLLSSNGGRDMAVLLDTLADMRYETAYRCLDARFFGVPQRRRRVFIVARRADAELSPGDAGRAALRVVWEGGTGDPTPGWPPREIVTSLVDGAAREDLCGRSLNTIDSLAQNLSPTVTTKWGTTGSGGPAGSETQNLIAEKAGRIYALQDIRAMNKQQNGCGWSEDGVAYTLDRADTQGVAVAGKLPAPIAIQNTIIGRALTSGPQGKGHGESDGPMFTLDTTSAHGVAYDQLRKLTELECERLMGWPDLWTAPDGVKVSRGRRVAACGDGVVSWVVYWLGRRILLTDGIDLSPRPDVFG